MEKKIGSFDAKTKLSQLLRSVENGESFTITNRGRPIARLVPVDNDCTNTIINEIKALQKTQKPLSDENLKDYIEQGRD